MIDDKFGGKIKLVVPAIFLFLTTYVMFIPIRDEMLCIADALFSKLSPNDPTNLRTLIFVSAAGWSIVKFTYDAIINRRYIVPISWANFSLLFITYLLFRLDDNLFFFKLGSSSVALFDILFFFLFVLLSDYKVSNPPLTVTNQFIIEDDIDESNDLFGREKYAEKVVSAINSSLSKNSIGIAINAEWGFGKTFFLKMIKSKLSENDKNIIIWFNPWDREKGHASVESFFEQLESELKPFNSKASKKIRVYAENVMRPEEGDTVAMNLIRRLVQIVIPPISIDRQKSELSDIIVKTGKRIIVFVDDLDRLSGAEISNVMQLIRNSAGFRNTFFIVALDRSYVSNALQEDKYVYRNGAYLEKIFQIEILLPPVKINARKELLISLFSNFYGVKSKAYKEISEGLSKISSDPNFQFFLSDRGNIDILETYLENIRDVKRFFNSFNLTYALIHGDVEIEELLLLELIKYKSSSFYKLIARGELTEQAAYFISRWQFSKSKFAQIMQNTERLRLLAIPEEYFDIFKRALYYLYPPESYPEQGQFSSTNEPSVTKVRQSSVVYRKNHARYFNYNLFGDFSILEFNEAMARGMESVFEYVKILSHSSSQENGNPNALKHFIRFLEQHDFKTLEEYKLGINGYFFIVRNINTLNIDSIFTDLITREKVIRYFGDLDHNELINRFLLDDTLVLDNIDARDRIDFLRYFIYLSNRSDFSSNMPFIPDIPEMRNKCLQILDSEINSTSSNEEIVYYIVVRGLELGILDQNYFSRYRNYLNTHRSYFLKMALFSPDNSNTYKFFGYRQEIFGGNEGFKDFLSENMEYPCAQYILTKFIEFETLSADSMTITDYAISNPCIKLPLDRYLFS
jgi:hypothetical protein